MMTSSGLVNGTPKTNVELLVRNLPIDSELFLCWLQQNYIHFSDDSCHISDSAELLSEAEYYISMQGWRGYDPDKVNFP
jgi:hypothetical protein